MHFRLCLKALAVISLGVPLAAAPAIAAPAAESDPGCGGGGRTLYYSPHPLLDGRMPQGFPDSLYAQLRGPARELGYCLETVKDPRALLDTAKLGESLWMQPSVREEAAGSASLVVALLSVRDLARGKLAEAAARPLVSLRFSAAEALGLSSIAARKVAENLRSQYVADLLVRSHPPGANVRAGTGLEGTTPVEWVLPVGTMQVTLTRAGYIDLRREIDLSAPGQHTYDLQMSKRRFYHSRFFYPALAAGAMSLAAFAMENHYYGEYQGLGAAEAKNDPAVFGNTFRAAKNYERLGYTTMGLAWASLTLCFVF